MKIQSLIRHENILLPVEVEVSLVPGLPQIQFLGLPDQAIKESIHRIKSALRAQGFEFPRAQQVLVNLRPAHLKKNSRGLELAVALGLLWESEQLQRPELSEVLIYGELSLKGDVFEPEDLAEEFDLSGHTVWTGYGGPQHAPYTRLVLKELRDIHQPEVHPSSPRRYKIQRPSFGLDLLFNERQAELIQLLALGEHSALLAGPAGSGKSTLAKTVHSLLAPPSPEDLHIIHRSHRERPQAWEWRPLIQPHHSITPLGLIGGGVPVTRGEISRAHLGVLILDELLEFNPKAQEALREPMEEHLVRLRRGRHAQEFLAQALYLATTNLCPCGDWVPQGKVLCGRSIKRCQSYLEKLSGPFMDRFQILYFSQRHESPGSISGAALLEKLDHLRQWRQDLGTQDTRFQKPASRWSLEELIRDLDSFYFNEIFPRSLSSRRRELATLRVARTYADFDNSLTLEPRHIERALKLTFTTFESIKRLS